MPNRIDFKSHRLHDLLRQDISSIKGEGRFVHVLIDLFKIMIGQEYEFKVLDILMSMVLMKITKAIKQVHITSLKNRPKKQV